MARGITLTLSGTFSWIPWLEQGYRMIIEVSEPSGDMETAIFLHRNRVSDALLGTVIQDYQCVVSPEDLDLPENEPAVGGVFFRKDTVDAIVPSLELALRIFEKTQEQVAALINALNLKDRLSQVEDVECGEPAATSASVSESTSESV